MSELFIPGPCQFCGMCRPLRTLAGSLHDGICESCDQLRTKQLDPSKRWVPWNEARALAAARQASYLGSVRSRPARLPAVQAAAGSRAYRPQRRAS